MIVTLPWPNGTLHPNARAHRMVKARHTRQARHTARILCFEAGLRKLDVPGVTVALTLHPPDRRRRDLPDAISALKASIDGIADAIGIDDSRFRWRMPEAFADPIKGGAVVVEVTEA